MDILLIQQLFYARDAWRNNWAIHMELFVLSLFFFKVNLNIEQKAIELYAPYVSL